MVIDRPKRVRVDRLTSEYGIAKSEDLIGCLGKLKKRLGGDRLSSIITLIESADLKSAVALTLNYYDKTYSHGLQKRPAENLHPIAAETLTAPQVAQLLRNREFAISKNPA